MGLADNSGTSPAVSYTHADQLNRPQKITAKLNGTMVGTYLYNALQQRAAKMASGATTQFVYDSSGH